MIKTGIFSLFIAFAIISAVSCDNFGNGDIPEVKVEDIDFPFELVSIPGRDAVQWLAEYRKQENKGFFPVALGDRENLQMVLENMKFSEASTDQILEKAKKLDANEIFNEIADSDKDYYGQVMTGDWPGTIGKVSFTFNRHLLTGRFKKQVYIAKVPAKHAYELPAYLKVGGWNECPDPEKHVAIQKYWFDKYGAEMVSYLGDVLEFSVQNGPKTREDALTLAKEQFLYCPDTVYQGTESLSGLAAAILNADTWFFWWD